MKKRLTWAARAGALIPAAVLALSSCATPAIEVGRPVFSSLAEGSYEGSYAGQMGKATVLVGLAGGRMVSAELTAFESSPVGAKAKAVMPARVVAAQSLDVDLVSGASYSSQVILKAIEAALAKAAPAS
jgi:fumarate reductase flavoprotein subunit